MPPWCSRGLYLRKREGDLKVYSGYGFRKSEVGDVDVVRHGGEYHLFHLTLPNHDYIAHAVSKDGLHWRRVKNAPDYEHGQKCKNRER